MELISKKKLCVYYSSFFIAWDYVLIAFLLESGNKHLCSAFFSGGIFGSNNNIFISSGLTRSSAGFRSTASKLCEAVSTGGTHLFLVRANGRSNHRTAYTVIRVTNFDWNAIQFWKRAPSHHDLSSDWNPTAWS